MRNLKLSIVIVLSFLYPLNVFAGIHKKAGTTVGQILEFGVGARACGMGEAFTGLANDFSAIYWNPAGIAQIKDIEFNFIHNNWFQGIQYEFISTMLPVEEELGVIGLSGIVLKVDDIVGRDSAGNFTSNFEAKDSILSFSFGQRWTENLLWGITIKRVNLRIENRTANKVMFDIGGLYKLQDMGLTLGGTVQNISRGKIKFVKKDEKLPLNFKVGMSYKIPEKNAILALDLSKSTASNIRVNLGTEITLNPISKLRFGYNSANDAGSGFTAGIGFNIRDMIELDYAYIPYGELGDTHQISITTKFKTTD